MEVVVADVTSKDDLTKAFKVCGFLLSLASGLYLFIFVIKDAYAVFAVTVQDYASSGEEEIGKLMVDVAKEQHVKHFIFRYIPNYFICFTLTKQFSYHKKFIRRLREDQQRGSQSAALHEQSPR